MNLLPPIVESDILIAITDEAVSSPIIAKLTQLRVAYISDKESALATLQAKHDKATAIQAKAGDETQRAIDDLSAQVASLIAERDALESLRILMTERVGSVLKSGDSKQYEALAAEFLTPEIEKQRGKLLAAKADIEAKLASLP